MTHIGRIKVVEEKENELESVCICPHCGKKVLYGNMMMVSGSHCCPECHDEVYDTLKFLREHHYEAYVRLGKTHSDEPYQWRPEDDK